MFQNLHAEFKQFIDVELSSEGEGEDEDDRDGEENGMQGFGFEENKEDNTTGVDVEMKDATSLVSQA